MVGGSLAAVAALNAVGDRGAHGGRALSRRVPVQRARGLVKRLDDRLAHGIGRGDRRIAQAEVEHLVHADLRLALQPVGEQLANR